MVSGPTLLPHSPPPLPTVSPPPNPPSQGVTRIELVGATILVTVLAFGEWDRHRDANRPIVAAIGIFGVRFPDSRKFSTCGATSSRTWHKWLARYRALHDCLCFCRGRFQRPVRPGTEPSTQTTGGRRHRVFAMLRECTRATAIPHRQRHHQQQITGKNRYRNKDDNTTTYFKLL